MELTGRITGFTFDQYGRAQMTFTVNEKAAAMQGFDELKGRPLAIKVEIFRKKRSHAANRYFWVLCGKLAAATQQKKTDIYRHLIREIGDNFDIVSVRNEAVKDYIDNWERGRLGWVCDILGDSETPGYTDICTYYGSSTYNSKQMSDLIHSIIFDCKEQGIQTETPEEIAKMLSLWQENEEREGG